MKCHFAIALAVSTIGLSDNAMTAERDMLKLTCKEIADMPGAKPMAVAMWVSGYVHGKAGNPMMDGDKAHANAEKVAAYCKENPDATVASALEALAKM